MKNNVFSKSNRCFHRVLINIFSFSKDFSLSEITPGVSVSDTVRRLPCEFLFIGLHESNKLLWGLLNSTPDGAFWAFLNNFLSFNLKCFKVVDGTLNLFVEDLDVCDSNIESFFWVFTIRCAAIVALFHLSPITINLCFNNLNLEVNVIDSLFNPILPLLIDFFLSLSKEVFVTLRAWIANSAKRSFIFQSGDGMFENRVTESFKSWLFLCDPVRHRFRGYCWSGTLIISGRRLEPFDLLVLVVVVINIRLYNRFGRGSSGNSSINSRCVLIILCG